MVQSQDMSLRDALIKTGTQLIPRDLSVLIHLSENDPSYDGVVARPLEYDPIIESAETPLLAVESLFDMLGVHMGVYARPASLLSRESDRVYRQAFSFAELYTEISSEQISRDLIPRLGIGDQDVSVVIRDIRALQERAGTTNLAEIFRGY